MHPLVASAEQIAERVLFVAALEVDAAELVPESHLAVLAEAGLFGIAGSGAESPGSVLTDAVEALASGCLATAFVWVQHHGLVQALARSENTALRDAWLSRLCSGQKRAGQALGGVRPGPTRLIATPAEGGWRLDGRVPWVSGWQLVDVLQALAVTEQGELLSLLLEPTPSNSLQARPYSLVAANASSSVELVFDGYVVPVEQLLSRTEYVAPPAYEGGGRTNGSLALGVIRRCCALLGPSRLDAELVAARQELDRAPPETLAQARADAVELALRATSALVVSSGSRSITKQQHAQRLAREALFLSVFGSRPAIRAALLERLLEPRGGARSRPGTG